VENANFGTPYYGEYLGITKRKQMEGRIYIHIGKISMATRF
jgi:hypothetical protein